MNLALNLLLKSYEIRGITFAIIAHIQLKNSHLTQNSNLSISLETSFE